MKKTALLLLTVILCACVLAACVTQTPEEQDTKKEYEVKFKNLDDYVCDISAASSVGIMKNRVAGQQTTTKNNDSFWTRLFGTQTASADEATYVNSFVMQTENGGIENVTFRRIVTENAQTTVEGERTIRPKKDGGYKYIEFDAQEGLTYTITDDQGKVIAENFVDNCQADLNPTVGYAKVEVGNIGHSYIVRYSGSGTEEILTQDDLDCEVRKCVTMGNLTFVSFVVKGYAFRESHITGRQDAHCVDYFDKMNYGSYGMDLIYRIDEKGLYTIDPSNGSHNGTSPEQGYVIDNDSGCIYKLNVNIDFLNEGLALIDGLVYEVKVNQDNALEFAPIVKNKSLQIKNFFKDKYGNVYVYNDLLNAVDEQHNALYYTDNKYVITDDGTVLCIDWPNHEIAAIDVMDENFEKQKIDASKNYNLSATIKNDYNEDYVVNFIQDGYLYIENNYLSRINVITLETETVADFDGQFMSVLAQPQNGKIEAYVFAGYDQNNRTPYYCEDIWAADKLFDIVYDESGAAQTVLNENVLSKIEEVDSAVGLHYAYGKYGLIKYDRRTIDGNKRFCILYDDNGKRYSVLESSYVAEDVESITLQPINR